MQKSSYYWRWSLKLFICNVCLCWEREDGGRGRGENRVNENLGSFLECFLERWNMFWPNLSYRWSKAISTMWCKTSFYQHSQNCPAPWKFSAQLHFIPAFVVALGHQLPYFYAEKSDSYTTISEFGITSKGTYIYISRYWIYNVSYLGCSLTFETTFTQYSSFLWSESCLQASFKNFKKLHINAPVACTVARTINESTSGLDQHIGRSCLHGSASWL